MGEAAQSNPLLTCVVSDYGRRLSLERMRELLPESFVQCGIAEQSQVTIAAALANEGYAVVAPAYASFITSRCFDQVRVCLGSMGAPVVLVGIAGGYGSGILGSTHLSLNDVALMRTVQGMTVACPSDNAEFWCCLRELVARPRPAYVRMPSLPAGAIVHDGGCDAGLDGARVLVAAADPDVVLVCTGGVTLGAMHAARILEAEGITCQVLEMSVIEPLDVTSIDHISPESLVVTVEEHYLAGGLGSAISEHLSSRCAPPRVLHLAAPYSDFEADDPENLVTRAGLSADAIANRVRKALVGEANPDRFAYQSRSFLSANCEADCSSHDCDCAHAMKSGTSAMIGSDSWTASTASSKLDGATAGRSGR